MTAESESCFEFSLSRRLSGSGCDRTELILVIGGESMFAWERGCMEFRDFLGPSFTDGGPEG